jgi:argininosuccinate lyase
MVKKSWSGRFAKSTDREVEKFTASLGYDRRLYPYDIQGSIAHCRMLAHCGIVTRAESAKIIQGLEQIRKELDSGKFPFRIEDEDIHMAVERRLIEKIGSVGGKLHTARSRNDQVALDLRMFLKDEIREIVEKIDNLRKTLVKRAKQWIGIEIPGYTHLQPAQPVLLAHHLLAYCEMFGRDVSRFEEAYSRCDVLPLGSAALAGTNYKIDRGYVANQLGFKQVGANSMDGVGDRDFCIDFCSASAVLMMHLSRMSEELVLWSTAEFGYLNLPDAYCTGSSIMPQKKNPDVPELVRGKTGRVYGSLISLLTTLKSLPLTYNRDLQEDKEPVFDTVDTVKGSLTVLAGLVFEMEPNKNRIREAVSKGFMTAVDLADYLVGRGVPFRESHRIVGRLVLHCIEKGLRFDELSPSELLKFSNRFDGNFRNWIRVDRSIARKDHLGGTSKNQVRRQIRRLEKELQ